MSKISLPWIATLLLSSMLNVAISQWSKVMHSHPYNSPSDLLLMNSRWCSQMEPGTCLLSWCQSWRCSCTLPLPSWMCLFLTQAPGLVWSLREPLREVEIGEVCGCQKDPLPEPTGFPVANIWGCAMLAESWSKDRIISTNGSRSIRKLLQIGFFWVSFHLCQALFWVSWWQRSHPPATGKAGRNDTPFWDGPTFTVF